MKNNVKTSRPNWAKSLLDDELKFWFSWFSSKGLDWPEDYANRLNPDKEVQDSIANFLVSGKERILDVGSGPLTVIGKKFNGKKLDITACDALGQQYKELFFKFNIKPLVDVLTCEMEQLTDIFDFNLFDIVYAQNCVDHSYDPFAGIEQMLHVAKPGGLVLLFHELNEAENENYQGLHQWNFYEKDHCFWIRGEELAICVDEYFVDIANVLTIVKGGYIFNVLQKKE